MKQIKHMLCFALALCLLLGSLPMSVRAAEVTPPATEAPEVPDVTVAPTAAPEVPGETTPPTEAPEAPEETVPPTKVLDEIITGTCGQEALWTLNVTEGTLTISGSGIVTNYTESNPAPWNEYADQILYVIVEDGISRIGNFAFAGFTDLIGVELADSVLTIGTYAFQDCSNLPQITLPSGLTKIAIRTFEGCAALTSVVIPESVTTIDIGAFIDCTTLTSVQIPNSVTSLGSSAFSGCTALASVTLPANITAIESNSFYGCTALKEIAIPEGVTTIGTRAFYGCTGLTTAALPSTLTSVGDYAFYNCTALNGLLLPNGLETIGSYAFARCLQVKHLVIPETVTAIGNGAFSGCTALEQVGFLGDAPQLGEAVFSGATATFFYPEGNETWTDEAKAQFGDSVTWEAGCEEHDFQISGLVTETCTEPGYSGDIKCAVCGLTALEGHETAALGHNVASGTQPMHDAGQKTHTYACGRCEDGLREECTFDEGIVIEEATMGQPGIKEFHCVKCGGTYTSAYTLESMIHRVYGANRYLTSFAAADMMKQTLCVTKFDTVIIANGMGFPDALSGSYLATVKNAPILLTNQHNLESVKAYINENLKVGGTVYLLGGTAALPESLEAGLNTFTVKRLFGENRYETNLAVLSEVDVGAKDILVCTGTNFADSLSASAVNRPILLVGRTLTDAQKEFLAGLNGNKLYIIGGPSAVSAELEAELTAYGTVERIGGNNRYETSVLVAHTFVRSPAAVVLAYAQNFPDGLCGGPLAFSMGAPLVLTADNKESAAKEYVQRYHITNGMILGGTGLISDQTVASIFE